MTDYWLVLEPSADLDIEAAATGREEVGSLIKTSLCERRFRSPDRLLLKAHPFYLLIFK